MARRMDLLNKITRQLAVLACEVELMNRSNRMTLNSDAETIFCGLINRLEGWNLRNLNEVSQNYPGIDLADPERRIAVQITASANAKKVSHTLEVFFKNRMEREFDRLILVIITDKAAPTNGTTMKPGFRFDPKKDIWNIEWFKRRVESIEDCELLQNVADFLDSQLGDLPGAAKRPMYLLPAVPAIGAHFLPGSRDAELAAMEKDLNQGKPVFIWGLGGMGKTEAAIALANRCAGERGAYFLRYTLPAGDGEAMTETILRADFCGLNDGAETPDKAYGARLDILRREYRDTVLVIDGFDWPGKGFEQLKAEQSFRDVLALSNEGVSLIFTTRYPVGEPAWEIGPLPEERLVELMRRSCPDCGESQLLQLIRAVEGHTLMAELMARTLEESWNTVTPAQILEALQRSTLDAADFPAVISDQNGTYAHAKIHKHLQALFDLAGLSDDAKNVLRCAALLPGEGMADMLFMSCFGGAEQQELKDLVKRGWLRRMNRKVAMHPVVAQVCGGQYAGEGEDPFLEALWQRYDGGECEDEALGQIAATFLAAAPRLRDPGAALDCLRRALAVWRALVPTAERDLAVYDDWTDPFRQLANPEQAVRFKQSALTTKKKLLPARDPGVAAALGNLGLAWRTAADYEKALEYGRASLELWEKMFNGPHPDLARGHSSLARTCYEMGDCAQALRHLEAALGIWLRIVDPGHPNIAAVERNIEFVRAEMQ